MRVASRRPSGVSGTFPLALVYDGGQVWAYGRQGHTVVGSDLYGGGRHELALRTVSAACRCGDEVVVAGAEPDGRPCLAVGEELVELPGEGRVTAWPALAPAGPGEVALAWGLEGRVMMGWCDGRNFEEAPSVPVDDDVDQLALGTDGTTLVIAWSLLSTPGVAVARMEKGAAPATLISAANRRAPMLWVGTGGRVVWMSPDHGLLDDGAGKPLTLPEAGRVTTAVLLDDLFVWVAANPSEGSAAWAAPVDFDQRTVGDPVRLSGGGAGLAAVVTGLNSAITVHEGPPTTVVELEVH